MAVLTVSLMTLFSLLAFVMAIAIVYGSSTDFMNMNADARWQQVAMALFFLQITHISAWFFYKESRWILRIVFIVIVISLGSFTVCGYIVLQLFKLSPEESLKDPIYFALVRRQKRDTMGGVSVVTARIHFISLGCQMLGIVVFVFAIDGSPFQAKNFTPSMITSLVDSTILVVVFSVWVAYKESSWKSAFVWILLNICSLSLTMCAYIARELFYLSPDQPISLVLFNKSNRDLMLNDPLMVEHGNV